MRSLRNKSGSHSDSESEDGYGSAEEFTSADGWDDDIGLDITTQDKNISSKIINIANNKFALKNILKSLKLSWIITHSPSGWTHKTRCPFPDHNDSTPSFSYNSKDDLFKCFGCSKGGKAVDFLSAYTGKSKISIAHDLIQRLNLDSVQLEFEINNIDDSNDYLELDIDFSEFVYDFINRNLNKPGLDKIVSSITWNLDTYIEKHYGKNIDKESFLQRIQLLKNRLLHWEKING